MKKEYNIQKERFADIQGELPRFFSQQYDEVVTDKDGLLDNVDYERYCKLEELEVLHCLTVRRGRKLVGYIFTMIVYHLHHKGMKISHSDMVYILPGYRKGTGIGITLISKYVKEMKKLNVKKMYVGAKKDTGLNTILKYFKFRHIENIYSRKIG